MRFVPRCFSILALVFAVLVAGRAQAVVYKVDREFTDGFGTAQLTGTLSVPLGNYVIQNAGPSPFTGVDLTLTTNAIQYPLGNALTGLVFGSGQFTIDATATTLTFNAVGNGANPADLVFSDNLDVSTPNRYVIGSNGNPAFQAAYTLNAFVLTSVSFPNEFGVAIPEPASVALLAMAAVGVIRGRRKR